MSRSANWYELIVIGHEDRNTILNATTHAQARKAAKVAIGDFEAEYRIKHTYSSGIVEYIDI